MSGVDAALIARQLVLTRARLDVACVAAGRAAADVSLMAVSKRQPVEALRAALPSDWQLGLEPEPVFGGRMLVLRAGGVTLEALQEVCSQVEMRTGASAGSPGLLKSHYAPHTRLVVGNLARLADEYAGHKLAVLALSDFPRAENIISSEILAANGDLALAARHLFTAMRRLDQSGADLIIAERMPEHGFGIAINDRLERASAE